MPPTRLVRRVRRVDRRAEFRRPVCVIKDAPCLGQPRASKFVDLYQHEVGPTLIQEYMVNNTRVYGQFGKAGGELDNDIAGISARLLWFKESWTGLGHASIARAGPCRHTYLTVFFEINRGGVNCAKI